MCVRVYDGIGSEYKDLKIYIFRVIYCYYILITQLVGLDHLFAYLMNMPTNPTILCACVYVCHHTPPEVSSGCCEDVKDKVVLYNEDIINTCMIKINDSIMLQTITYTLKLNLYYYQTYSNIALSFMN